MSGRHVMVYGVGGVAQSERNGRDGHRKALDSEVFIVFIGENIDRFTNGCVRERPHFETTISLQTEML